MKKCNKCHIQKDSNEYYSHPTSKDGKQSSCIVCQNAHSKAYMLARKNAERSVVVDAKVCLDCGLKKPIGQFGKKSASLDKHNEYCKACWRERCSIANKKHYTKLLRNYAKN